MPDQDQSHELQVLDPATEEVVATVPAADAGDVHRAVERAVAAQRAWAT
ncbi:aldehyde dehydrogenase family protein, partial [Streptomyces spiralis]